MKLTINQLIDSIQWILGYEKNRQNINIKAYIAFINQTIGTKYSYCPSCASAMKQIHSSFQINIYRQVRDTLELQQFLLPIPDFKSNKFNSEYFKNEISALPIDYILNNINDANNRALEIQRYSKLQAELEQRILILDDIKLLEQYRDARYTYDEFINQKVQELWLANTELEKQRLKQMQESINESINIDDSEQSIEDVKEKQKEAVKKNKIRTNKK